MQHLSTRLLAFLLVLAAAASPLQAQDSGDGSIYSRFGVGELRSFATSQIQAMGGGGTGLASLNYVNLANPASYSDQVFTRLAASAEYQTVLAENAANETSRLSSGTLNAMQLSFPLLTNRLGVAVSFSPYSRVNYRVPLEGQLDADANAGRDVAVPYRIDFEGSGGLQQVRAGLGYRFTDYLSAGVAVDLVWGILEEEQHTTFFTSVETGDYASTDLSNSTRLAGVTGTLGLNLRLPDLLRANDELMLGMTVTPPLYLNGTRVQTLGEDLDRDTLGTRFEGDMRLPLQAAVGAAYRLGASFTALADVQYAPWSSGFDSDFSLPGYPVDGPSTFEDRLRLSSGVEILPAGTDLFASYLSRIAYRLGVAYEQAYAGPAVSSNLNTMALTGGLSLPTVLPGTRLDVNVEVGRRGTTDDQLVRDTYYRFALSVNIGERWFLKRKLR